MPIHDWTTVEAGIFHAFHHRWISAISDALNSGLLPSDLYALPEQIVGKYEPDVVTLQSNRASEVDDARGETSTGTVLQTRPTATIVATTEVEFYRKKKSSIAVRHVSDDEVVAMIEIVLAGNKSGRYVMHTFVEKACALLDQGIHLLIVDLSPPGPRDPNGVHGLIWQEISTEPFHLPDNKPLTLVSYECDVLTRAYVEPVAVGDVLPSLELFLKPNGCIKIPLEETYRIAFELLPRRWRDVLQPA